MYLAQERRQYILRLLEQRGSIRTTALAREIGVTDETIRTDLVDMQARGLLERVHGGARYILPQNASSAVDSPRLDEQLAHLACAHIQPGMCIYAEDCALTRIIAAQLAHTPVTFITPSYALLADLSPAAVPHRLICTGGKLDKASGLLVHPYPAAILAQHSLDLALLSPTGMTPSQALYTHSTHAAWAAAAAQQASTTLVVAPSSILTATAPCAADLGTYTLITEDNLPAGFEDIPSETVPYISEDSINDYNY